MDTTFNLNRRAATVVARDDKGNFLDCRSICFTDYSSLKEEVRVNNLGIVLARKLALQKVIME
ncbi:hypothetical protein MKX01_039163, partial [Papaver californicum]